MGFNCKQKFNDFMLKRDLKVLQKLSVRVLWFCRMLYFSKILFKEKLKILIKNPEIGNKCEQNEKIINNAAHVIFYK